MWTLDVTEGDRGAVMVAVEGKAQRRDVRLGIVTRDTAEVLEGLAAGEQVLSGGQYGLPDGAAVEPLTSAGQ